MKRILYIPIIVSFVFTQQGLNLTDLDPGEGGKLMYPYSGKTFENWPNGDPSGDFIRGAEPLPKNLNILSETVLKTKADIGLALDPDADRLAVVSNKGTPIGDEYTLALAADGYIRGKQSEETFVINLSTSMVLEEIANKNNCKVIRTAVGEINVVEKMIEIGAELGGE